MKIDAPHRVTVQRRDGLHPNAKHRFKGASKAVNWNLEHNEN
jgi:hypothetical protein